MKNSKMFFYRDVNSKKILKHFEVSIKASRSRHLAYCRQIFTFA